MMASQSPVQPSARTPVDRTAGLDLQFAAVYEEHFAFVWRTLRSLGIGDGSIDDAAQEVFVVVHRRLREFEGRSTLRSWLYGIVIRVVHDYRRRLRRKDPWVRSAQEAPDVEAVQAPEAMGPDACAEQNDAVRALQECLDQLDWDKRQVLVLVELEQMTVPEVAELTGIKENTIYGRLRAARRDFEEIVVRYQARQRWRET